MLHKQMKNHNTWIFKFEMKLGISYYTIFCKEIYIKTLGESITKGKKFHIVKGIDHWKKLIAGM